MGEYIKNMNQTQSNIKDHYTWRHKKEPPGRIHQTAAFSLLVSQSG